MRVPGPGRAPVGGGGVAFTLVEVMIAMGILGVIMVAIYASWSAILRGSRAGLTAASEVQRMRVAMRTVEEALWGVKMFVQNPGYYSFLVDTNGPQTALSFAAYLPESFPRSGRYSNEPIRRVTFAVEEGRDRVPELVLRQHPLLSLVDQDEDENPLVLARDVGVFEVQFWGVNSREWEGAWPYTNQLPKLVKVTLGFGRQGAFGRSVREVAVRIVALPAVAVPVEWQRPGGGRGAGPGQTNQPPGGVGGPGGARDPRTGAPISTPGAVINPGSQG